MFPCTKVFRYLEHSMKIVVQPSINYPADVFISPSSEMNFFCDHWNFLQGLPLHTDAPESLKCCYITEPEVHMILPNSFSISPQNHLPASDLFLGNLSNNFCWIFINRLVFVSWTFKSAVSSISDTHAYFTTYKFVEKAQLYTPSGISWWVLIIHVEVRTFSSISKLVFMLCIIGCLVS